MLNKLFYGFLFFLLSLMTLTLGYANDCRAITSSDNDIPILLSGNLTDANFTQDITGFKFCFTLEEDVTNIIIDCQDHNISGDVNGGFFIDFSVLGSTKAIDSFTLKNCNFENFIVSSTINTQIINFVSNNNLSAINIIDSNFINTYSNIIFINNYLSSGPNPTNKYTIDSLDINFSDSNISSSASIINIDSNLGISELTLTDFNFVFNNNILDVNSDLNIVNINNSDLTLGDSFMAFDIYPQDSNLQFIFDNVNINYFEIKGLDIDLNLNTQLGSNEVSLINMKNKTSTISEIKFLDSDLNFIQTVFGFIETDNLLLNFQDTNVNLYSGRGITLFLLDINTFDINNFNISSSIGLPLIATLSDINYINIFDSNIFYNNSGFLFQSLNSDIYLDFNFYNSTVNVSTFIGLNDAISHLDVNYGELNIYGTNSDIVCNTLFDTNNSTSTINLQDANITLDGNMFIAENSNFSGLFYNNVFNLINFDFNTSSNSEFNIDFNTTIESNTNKRDLIITDDNTNIAGNLWLSSGDLDFECYIANDGVCSSSEYDAFGLGSYVIDDDLGIIDYAPLVRNEDLLLNAIKCGSIDTTTYNIFSDIINDDFNLDTNTCLYLDFTEPQDTITINCNYYNINLSLDGDFFDMNNNDVNNIVFENCNIDLNSEILGFNLGSGIDSFTLKDSNLYLDENANGFELSGNINDFNFINDNSYISLEGARAFDYNIYSIFNLSDLNINSITFNDLNVFMNSENGFFIRFIDHSNVDINYIIFNNSDLNLNIGSAFLLQSNGSNLDIDCSGLNIISNSSFINITDDYTGSLTIHDLEIDTNNTFYFTSNAVVDFNLYNSFITADSLITIEDDSNVNALIYNNKFIDDDNTNVFINANENSNFDFNIELQDNLANRQLLGLIDDSSKIGGNYWVNSSNVNYASGNNNGIGNPLLIKGSTVNYYDYLPLTLDATFISGCMDLNTDYYNKTLVLDSNINNWNGNCFRLLDGNQDYNLTINCNNHEINEADALDTFFYTNGINLNSITFRNCDMNILNSNYVFNLDSNINYINIFDSNLISGHSLFYSDAVLDTISLNFLGTNEINIDSYALIDFNFITSLTINNLECNLGDVGGSIINTTYLEKFNYFDSNVVGNKTLLNINNTSNIEYLDINFYNSIINTSASLFMFGDINNINLYNFNTNILRPNNRSNSIIFDDSNINILNVNIESDLNFLNRLNDSYISLKNNTVINTINIGSAFDTNLSNGNLIYVENSVLNNILFSESVEDTLNLYNFNLVDINASNIDELNVDYFTSYLDENSRIIKTIDSNISKIYIDANIYGDGTPFYFENLENNLDVNTFISNGVYYNLNNSLIDLNNCDLNNVNIYSINGYIDGNVFNFIDTNINTFNMLYSFINLGYFFNSLDSNVSGKISNNVFLDANILDLTKYWFFGDINSNLDINFNLDYSSNASIRSQIPITYEYRDYYSTIGGNFWFAEDLLDTEDTINLAYEDIYSGVDQNISGSDGINDSRFSILGLISEVDTNFYDYYPLVKYNEEGEQTRGLKGSSTKYYDYRLRITNPNVFNTNNTLKIPYKITKSGTGEVDFANMKIYVKNNSNYELIKTINIEDLEDEGNIELNIDDSDIYNLVDSKGYLNMKYYLDIDDDKSTSNNIVENTLLVNHFKLDLSNVKINNEPINTKFIYTLGNNYELTFDLDYESINLQKDIKVNVMNDDLVVFTKDIKLGNTNGKSKNNEKYTIDLSLSNLFNNTEISNLIVDITGYPKDSDDYKKIYNKINSEKQELLVANKLNEIYFSSVLSDLKIEIFGVNVKENINIDLEYEYIEDKIDVPVPNAPEPSPKEGPDNKIDENKNITIFDEGYWKDGVYYINYKNKLGVGELQIIQILDSDKNPIINQDIIILYNGESWIIKTDELGYAKFTPEYEGIYSLKVPYPEEKVTGKFEAVKDYISTSSDFIELTNHSAVAEIFYKNVSYVIIIGIALIVALGIVAYLIFRPKKTVSVWN